eukprot:GCRY01002332.1.p1 GENE.GCRY01002332.1~~GCRY01002332.1.p1  ORF type:complete len:584 (+),score=101.10 GCRY01002332.1:182-1933(+)
MQTVLCCGHRNPDSDSICSAFAYAHLKNEITKRETLDRERLDLLRRSTSTKDLSLAVVENVSNRNVYIATRCGEPNAQTRFIFSKANATLPRYQRDALLHVSDAMTKTVKHIEDDAPVAEALDMLQKSIHRDMILPVVDKDSYVLNGVLSLSHISSFTLNGYTIDDPLHSIVPANIHKVLDGFVIKRATPHYDSMKVQLMICSMELYEVVDILDKTTNPIALIIGQRSDILKFVMESMQEKVVAIILVGMDPQKEVRIDFSHYRGLVYASPVDSAETLRKIVLSTPCSEVMECCQHFTPQTYLEEAKQFLIKQGHRGLPVCDTEKRLLGILTRTDVLKAPKKKLIMMDHNELQQAIEGADQADIVEIVDHHRLGTIKTNNPINFICKPVGSTCTLVTQQFKLQQFPIPQEVGMVLLGGIVSDTLGLKSPTATIDDFFAVNELAEVTGVDWEEFAKEVLSASEGLANRSPKEAIGADFKTYEEYGFSFGIGQVEVSNLQEVNSVKKALMETILSVRDEHKLDFAMLMITDVAHGESILLTSPHKTVEGQLSYKPVCLKDRLYHMPGVLSRKKQLLPEILRLLQE